MLRRVEAGVCLNPAVFVSGKALAAGFCGRITRIERLASHDFCESRQTPGYALGFGRRRWVCSRIRENSEALVIPPEVSRLLLRESTPPLPVRTQIAGDCEFRES